MTPAPCAYVARKPCGCAVACIVEDPKARQRDAREIGEWMLRGWTVERIPASDLEDGEVFKRCPHK